MGRRRTTRRLGGDFNLGGEQAEADPLLQAAFFDSGDYAAIASKDDPRCIVIGRTGGGKSATLQRLEEQNPDHVVRINPEDLSLQYISDLGAVRQLDALQVHLDPFFIALWKHVLLVELIRKRYHVDSPAAKLNFLTTLRERLVRDPAKRSALDYLDEFEGRFWCETDVRVREITETFESKIKAEASAGVGLSGVGEVGIGAGTASRMSSQVRSELADRFQRIVNETQLARLNKMIAVLDEDILDSRQLFTYVVIDDLDRDWADERIANDLIRCLFRTVLDLKRVRNLKIIVALRTNIFAELQFGERSGAQEEKFRSLVLRMEWIKADLRELLDERARVASERLDILPIPSTDELLPATNKARGRALDYVLDRTLMRPRDAIAFMNEALRVGRGKARLSWADLQSAEGPYSKNRLLALRDEWKATYPGIDRLFELFQGARVPLSREELTSRLDEAMLLPADSAFLGSRWLTELSEPMWSAGAGDRDWVELYHPLVRFLFLVGFIGLSRAMGSKRIVYSSEEGTFADLPSNLQEIKYFYVHPAFRKALDTRERGSRKTATVLDKPAGRI